MTSGASGLDITPLKADTIPAFVTYVVFSVGVYIVHIILVTRKSWHGSLELLTRFKDEQTRLFTQALFWRSALLRRDG